MGRQTKYQRAWYERNREAVLARNLAWERANPEKVRAGKRRRYTERYRYSRFGLTAESFADLLASQDGRCAICRSPEANTAHGWCVDHDHVTGETRGILCGPCNTSLGYYEKRIRPNLSEFDAYLACSPMTRLRRGSLSVITRESAES